MSAWRGNQTVRAGNRAIACEAMLANALWRAQRQLAAGERVNAYVPERIIRSLASQASDAAAVQRDRAETYFRAAETEPKLVYIAMYHAEQAEQAEAWAERAHACKA